MSRRWQAAYISKGDGAGTIAHTHRIRHARSCKSLVRGCGSAGEAVGRATGETFVFTKKKPQRHRHTGIPGQSSHGTSFQMLNPWHTGWFVRKAWPWCCKWHCHLQQYQPYTVNINPTPPSGARWTETSRVTFTSSASSNKTFQGCACALR